MGKTGKAGKAGSKVKTKKQRGGYWVNMGIDDIIAMAKPENYPNSILATEDIIKLHDIFEKKFKGDKSKICKSIDKINQAIRNTDDEDEKRHLRLITDQLKDPIDFYKMNKYRNCCYYDEIEIDGRCIPDETDEMIALKEEDLMAIARENPNMKANAEPDDGNNRNQSPAYSRKLLNELTPDNVIYFRNKTKGNMIWVDKIVPNENGGKKIYGFKKIYEKDPNEDQRSDIMLDFVDYQQEITINLSPEDLDPNASDDLRQEDFKDGNFWIEKLTMDEIEFYTNPEEYKRKQKEKQKAEKERSTREYNEREHERIIQDRINNITELKKAKYITYTGKTNNDCVKNKENGVMLGQYDKLKVINPNLDEDSPGGVKKIIFSVQKVDKNNDTPISKEFRISLNRFNCLYLFEVFDKGKEESYNNYLRLAEYHRHGGKKTRRRRRKHNKTKRSRSKRSRSKRSRTKRSRTKRSRTKHRK
jgi:hypothetical protein